MGLRMMEGRNAVPGECQVSLGVALGSVQGSLDFKKGQWEKAHRNGVRKSPDLATCGQLKVPLGGLKISLLRQRLCCLLPEGSHLVF